MGNPWTAEYDSDELADLERQASDIDRESENVEEAMDRLQQRLDRLNAEGARIDNEGRQAAAEIRADAEGISIPQALTANERTLREAAEAATRDARIRRMESGYAQ
jgi:hypothetical protein